MGVLKSVQFAEDYDRRKARFPVYVQPKYDGFRGCNLFGRLTARSLRPFDNRYASLFFSQNPFLGLDGELCAAAVDDENLCHATNSALSTHTGEPWIMWHVFDYLRPETVDLRYSERYKILEERVMRLKDQIPELGAHLTMMPSVKVYDLVELDQHVYAHCDAGLEGTIVRADLPHKNGRSSPTHHGLLRIKPFIEVDALVLKIYEGQQNNNAAKTNHLGHTERSTHKENMVPNGMVGAVEAELLEDAKHPLTGVVVLRKGTLVRFSAGCLTHDERKRYFQEQHLLNGKIIKGRIFAHGTKEKARMPTIQSLRMTQDYIKK